MMQDTFETISKNFIKDFQGILDGENRFDGTGSIDFVSGNRYEGQFEAGKLHGQGTYNWRDGVSYKGEFTLNKISGTGEFDWYELGGAYLGKTKRNTKDKCWKDFEMVMASLKLLKVLKLLKEIGNLAKQMELGR
jgi:hypothetical protein